MCTEHSTDTGEVDSLIQYFAMDGVPHFFISRILLVCHVWQHVVPKDSCSPFLGLLSFNFVPHLFCSCKYDTGVGLDGCVLRIGKNN